MGFSLVAQTTPVEVIKSNEKVLLGGKAFYIHVVKKGETLYSIAKAYNVSVNDIISVNPAAANEIKPEQVLRIPESSSPAPKEAKALKDTGDILHVVVQGQTLYSISRLYGVSLEGIEKLNPEVKYDSLQVNQVLKIPKTDKKDNAVTAVDESSKYIIHTVANQETLYSLSKKYNVSQEDIQKTNPEIQQYGLKAGQVIRIPRAEIPAKSSGTHTVVPAATPVSDPAKSQYIQTTKANCDTIINETKKVKLALLLPLFASATTTESEDEGDDSPSEERLRDKQTEEFNPVGMNFIEFYQGVLVAIDELRKKGIEIELNVYDTEKDLGKVQAILKKTELTGCDAIIGPMYPEQLKEVSDFGLAHSIPVISPILTNEDILSQNPYFFQVNPGKIRENIANITLLKNYPKDNILVVYNSTIANLGGYDEYKKLLKEHLGDSVKIKEINVYGNDFKIIKDELDSLRNNIVISPVTEEMFSTTLLSTIESTLVIDTVLTIGMLEWTYYKGIDLNYFYDQQLMFNAPYFTDYETLQAQVFLKEYRSIFNTDPIKSSKLGFNYAMLGYDVSKYFINGIAKYGKEIGRYSSCIKSSQLCTNLKFQKISPDGGFVNQFMILSKYQKDYTIVRTDNILK